MRSLILKSIVWTQNIIENEVISDRIVFWFEAHILLNMTFEVIYNEGFCSDNSCL